METMHVKLLGVRGGLPVWGDEYRRYGGSTMCVLLQAGGESILLDAGSGIARVGELGGGLTVLLSHPHADHLIGFPYCPQLTIPGRRVTVWGADREGADIRSQLDTLMRPPLWPVRTGDLAAEIDWRSLPEAPVYAGQVRIDHAPGSHPGGVTVYRLSYKEKSVVYATDCELDASVFDSLVAFAENCDLLLCDGQFSDDEYPARVGWGHSSVSMALKLSEKCAAKRTVFIHHSPGQSDDALDALSRRLAAAPGNCSIGRQGEELYI